MGVIGNPCHDAGKIPYEAPEVRCDGNTLIGAPISDHGHVIIAMFFDDEEQYANRAYQEPEFKEHCDERARMGYNSGMGEIFRHVAGISPVKVAPQIALSRRRELSRLHFSGMITCITAWKSYLALAATHCNK